MPIDWEARIAATIAAEHEFMIKVVGPGVRRVWRPAGRRDREKDCRGSRSLSSEITSAFGGIVLQKSFCTGDQKFCGL